MGNVIKRDTVFIEAVALTESSAFNVDDEVTFFKRDNNWLTRKDGKYYQTFISHVRNEHFYYVVNQYSIKDIVLMIQNRDESYCSVFWDFFVEAIETTFKETEIKCVDDICDYIMENLI